MSGEPAGRARVRVPGPRALLGSLLLTAAILAVGLLACPFVVHGSSMTATLTPGEWLLVDRLDIHDLSRGDVIIFRPPIPGYTGEPYVKRVIGLPGDVVAIGGGGVHVNGDLLPEPYLVPGTQTTTVSGALEVRVPPGSVFVLGDHRTNSDDSRDYGPIPVSAVLGRAWLGVEVGDPLLTLMP